MRREERDPSRSGAQGPAGTEKPKGAGSLKRNKAEGATYSASLPGTAACGSRRAPGEGMPAACAWRAGSAGPGKAGTQDGEPGGPEAVEGPGAPPELHFQPGPDEAAPGHPGSAHRTEPASSTSFRATLPSSPCRWALESLVPASQATASPSLALVLLPLAPHLESGLVGTALPQSRGEAGKDKGPGSLLGRGRAESRIGGGRSSIRALHLKHVSDPFPSVGMRRAVGAAQ